MPTIALQHSVGDYMCMTNGLEDMYAAATRSKPLPPFFLFGLSGFCNPVYLKFPAALSDIPRMVYINMALPRLVYRKLAKLLHCSCKTIEGKGFARTLDAAKKAVDDGRPVILGACDMFYLPYFEKHFQRAHVVVHFILMIGYDDAAGCVTVLDNARPEPQTLAYGDLERAWGVQTKWFSKKHTMRVFTFRDPTPDPQSVFVRALRDKANSSLRSKAGVWGLRSYDKLAKDLCRWEREMPRGKFRKSVALLVENCGFPPTPPLSADAAKITHRATRDRFATLLQWGAAEYGYEGLQTAAERFRESGRLIGELTALLLTTAAARKPVGEEAPALVREIAAREREGYEAILRALPEQ